MTLNEKQQAEKRLIAIINDNSKSTADLAESTGLPLVSADEREYPYTLQWVEKALTLRHHQQKRTVDINIDFTAGRALHRLKFGGGHGQPMARAVKSRDKPLVCDATAGFGKDAFVFASLGCEVVLLERSTVVHALLKDALQRASLNSETQSIAARMHLYHEDSSLLPGNWPHTTKPQVIYLDPMYPDAKRVAKKEIQTLRALLEKTRLDNTLVDESLVDESLVDKNPADKSKDDAMLLSAARATASRVVVKRPRKAKPLTDATPSGNIISPNTRYDIYSSS